MSTIYLYIFTLNVKPGIVGDTIARIDLNVMNRNPVLLTKHLFINENLGIVAVCRINCKSVHNVISGIVERL